jgi:type II secretory pathway pseudopilin PulG
MQDSHVTILEPLRARRARAGFTLVELLTAITILVFGIGALVSLVATTSAANRISRETALALSAAHGAIERMRGDDFEEVFARYNTDKNDDPGGFGKASGPSFAVDGLNPLNGDADGMEGEIVLPAAGPELYEDETLELFGLPRDLDMDSVVDAADHAGDYRVMPVLVRVSWQGRTGPRTIRLLTTLADL